MEHEHNVNLGRITTIRQLQTYFTIFDFHIEYQSAPTYRELIAATDVKSLDNMKKIVDQLAEKGYIYLRRNENEHLIQGTIVPLVNPKDILFGGQLMDVLLQDE